MKRLKTTGLAFILLGLGLTVLAAFPPSKRTAPEKKTHLQWAEIRGTIDPATSSYLKNAIREAKFNEAEALIVELDTPGGLVSSVKDMAQAIDQSEVPVILYVNPAGSSATSAGALLSLASHLTVMSQGTHIGAAHPVDSNGKEVPGVMGEKVTNDTAAFARGLAELRGRDPKVAESMVVQSKSFSATEALEKGLVDLVISESESLGKVLHGRRVKLTPKSEPKTLNTESATILRSQMTLGQKILHVLANPNLATLLITLGTLCLYVEITTPGLSLPGILGSMCLIVGFVSFQMLPIRFGALALILIGLAFVIAEFFVTTHGALALGGTLSFILGLLWVMDPDSTRLSISPAIWIPAALVLGAASFSAMWVARRLKQRVKDTLSQIGGHGSLGLEGYRGVLEKDQKALIRGEVWDVSFEEGSTPGQPGESVQVVRVEGFKVVVRKS